MNQSRTIVVAAVVAALVGVAPGQVWTAWTGFSPTQNPNGDWSLGWTQTLGSAFNLMPTPTTQFCGTPAWHAPSISQYLVVQMNPNNFPVTCGAGIYQPFGMVIHPGPSNERSVVRWTAPAAGSCSISASFPGVSLSPSSDVAVLHNSTVLGAAPVTLLNVGPSFFFQVAVQAGDTIDFIAGDGGNGYIGDATGLFATVSMDVGSIGPGCGVSPPILQTTPVVIGANATLSIANAVPSTFGVLFASAPIAAPIPVGGGCSVYLDLGTLAELVSFVTDTSGAWSLGISVPANPLLTGAQIALQAVVLPTAGSLGFDLSNGLLITVGG